MPHGHSACVSLAVVTLPAVIVVRALVWSGIRRRLGVRASIGSAITFFRPCQPMPTLTPARISGECQSRSQLVVAGAPAAWTTQHGPAQVPQPGHSVSPGANISICDARSAIGPHVAAALPSLIFSKLLKVKKPIYVDYSLENPSTNYQNPNLRCCFLRN